MKWGRKKKALKPGEYDSVLQSTKSQSAHCGVTVGGLNITVFSSALFRLWCVFWLYLSFSLFLSLCWVFIQLHLLKPLNLLCLFHCHSFCEKGTTWSICRGGKWSTLFWVFLKMRSSFNSSSFWGFCSSSSSYSSQSFLIFDNGGQELGCFFFCFSSSFFWDFFCFSYASWK